MTIGDVRYRKILQQVHDSVVRPFHIGAQGLLIAKGNQPLVPETGWLQKEIMEVAHDSPWAGYPEQKWMTTLLSWLVYWLSLKADVEHFI